MSANPLISLTILCLSLILLLAASEVMVRALSTVGEGLGLTEEALGFVVAIGSDAPEISSALFALLAGSQEIGLGVIEGSNIYNFAGLIGLSAIVAGPLVANRGTRLREGGVNLGLTGLAIALIAFTAARTPLAIVMLALFLAYGFVVLRRSRSAIRHLSLLRPGLLAFISVVVIVAASAVLVQAAIAVVHQSHVPQSVIGIFILPVATSLPNTWAALSLAKRGMGDAVLATTFNSNSINLALGIALPSFFIRFHPTLAERAFDGPYLLGITAVIVAMLLLTRNTARIGGMVIVGMYLAFALLRLLVV